ncbi:MAG TPA: hypothetical protein VFA44_14420 [Gaiellaceae bacterium]|nr:hypothetical protein [Gaiellaceae bacterium]
MDPAPDSLPLGELVVRRGLLDEEQLETALAAHLATGRSLGEILVEEGYLDREQLALLLAEQQASATASQPPPEPPAGAPRERAAEAEEQSPRGIELLRQRLAAARSELRGKAAGGEPAAVAERATLPSTPDEPLPAEREAVSDEAEGDAFVLFVPTPAGYSLLTRTGPLPGIGDEIGVSGGNLVVVKVGSSPLPGDPRRCVYLQAR